MQLLIPIILAVVVGSLAGFSCAAASGPRV